ncbi:MAG: aldo/keto reductase [Spirochaetota bacterium]
MEYRVYGKTGINVSFLGFGGMRFEEPGNIDKSVKTVLRAFGKGVNYFDTAPGYCNDKSEIIMGHAVREMKKTKKPFFISTKSSKHRASDLRKDLEKSLKRLNVESIDFLHSWCIMTLKDWADRKAGGAIEELKRAKDEGLIKHVVFSTHLPGPDIRKIIEEGHFEGVTLGYSAVNFPYREEGITAAHEKNMGVVVMNPLGGGLIVNNEKAFSFIKERPEQSMVEAALHFLMADKRISAAIVGLRNEMDVEAAVTAVENYIPYAEQQVAAIRDRVKGEYNDLCTTCMYCNVCPEGIPVWKFMDAYNHLVLEGGGTAANRLKWHWDTSIDELKACTECRQCESACTQHLSILERFERLKEAGK